MGSESKVEASSRAPSHAEGMVPALYWAHSSLSVSLRIASTKLASLTLTYCSHLGPLPTSEFHARHRESDAPQLVTRAFADASLKDGGLSLFGGTRHRLIPPRKMVSSHGSGTDRRLGPDEFALFDYTASLHGYWSDFTRTLALLASTIPKSTHLQMCNFFHSAQNIAFQTARTGVVAKRVDEAPRLFLGLAEYA
ncbi:hypothetical protein IW262DRAFT_1490146 [Armillaria fumosa]|nr:hypothetical protein IW262DRAFT_1490146 [Armillaria fumosa]